jgi:hypothetical protein
MAINIGPVSETANTLVVIAQLGHSGFDGVQKDRDAMVVCLVWLSRACFDNTGLAESETVMFETRTTSVNL